MATMDQDANSRSLENTSKGLVLGAVIGGLIGLSASISLLLISGSSFSLAMATLAVFTAMVAGVAGFIGLLIDLDQHEQTQNG